MEGVQAVVRFLLPVLGTGPVCWSRLLRPRIAFSLNEAPPSIIGVPLHVGRRRDKESAHSRTHTHVRRGKANTHSFDAKANQCLLHACQIEALRGCAVKVKGCWSNVVCMHMFMTIYACMCEHIASRLPYVMATGKL